MNQTTKKMFDLLRKAAEDSCKGGGFEGSGPYRPLFEPEDGDTTATGFIDLLNRDSLQVEWFSEKNKESPFAHDWMKPALQNDLVSQTHRDFQHRYTGRIGRMLHETARRQTHSDKKKGLISIAELNLTNFLSLSKESAQ